MYVLEAPTKDGVESERDMKWNRKNLPGAWMTYQTFWSDKEKTFKRMKKTVSDILCSYLPEEVLITQTKTGTEPCKWEF